MALNPNYEAIGKAFTTQYYQVLQGFLLFIIWPLLHAYACTWLRFGTKLKASIMTFILVENLFFVLGFVRFFFSKYSSFVRLTHIKRLVAQFEE